MNIASSPPGATVSRRPYGEPDRPWRALGTTPLSLDRFPIASSVLRLEAEGYHGALAGFDPMTSDPIVLDPVETVDPAWRSVPGDLPGYLGGPEFAFLRTCPWRRRCVSTTSGWPGTK